MASSAASWCLALPREHGTAASVPVVAQAALLGVDDGIVSVASLAIGVLASGTSANTVIAAAVAALVAGAVSMAAGEYA